LRVDSVIFDTERGKQLDDTLARKLYDVTVSLMLCC